MKATLELTLVKFLTAATNSVSTTSENEYASTALSSVFPKSE